MPGQVVCMTGVVRQHRGGEGEGRHCGVVRRQGG
jgi:hypothetical protein